MMYVWAIDMANTGKCAKVEMYRIEMQTSGEYRCVCVHVFVIACLCLSDLEL